MLKSSKPSSSSSLSPTPLHKRTDESNMWGVEASNDHVSFEHKFCSNFFCCNMRLPGMHELLEHVEEVHIMSPLAPPSHTSSADARPSHSNPGHPSLHRSPYDVVCAYPAPSTPPSLSQLFENEFDWSSTVYPDSQPDSPLIDVFPGLDEFSTMEDATYSSSLFGHHNELQQDLDISAGIPSSSQTSPNCIVSDSDSGAPENDTATTSVTLHADNSESMQKGVGSLSDPGTTSQNAVASTSGTVSGSKPPHSSLLSSSHAAHAPLVHSSVYSSQYNSYFPSHSSHDQKVRSSGPSRRPKNKAARKLPVGGTTSTVAGISGTKTKTKTNVGGRSGLPSAGSSRSLRGFNDLSLDDIATNGLGDVESGERTLKKGRIPIRREKKHRCPMPGCSKAYLNPGGLKYHLEKGTCKIELDQDGNDDVSKDEPNFSPDLSIEDLHAEDNAMESESAQFSSTHLDSPFISGSSLPPTSVSLHDTDNGSYDVQNPDSPVPLSTSLSSPASPHSLSVSTPSLTPEQLAAAAPVSSSANSDHPDTTKTFSHSYTSSNAHDPQGYEYPQQTTAGTSDTSSSSESDEEGHHNRHVVDSKKIHMSAPHVANAWRLEAYSDMSESDLD